MFTIFNLSVYLFSISLASDERLQVKKSNELSFSTSKQTLESGSVVELGKPPDVRYGVIRWIRSIDGEDKAYVEMVHKYDMYSINVVMHSYKNHVAKSFLHIHMVILAMLYMRICIAHTFWYGCSRVVEDLHMCV